MFCVLVLILFSVCVECQDLCQLIKPKGTYNGIGIYHRYRDTSGNDDFIMYNRAGYEWHFTLAFDGNKYSMIVQNEAFKQVKDEGVVHKFGIYQSGIVKIPKFADCTVKTTVKVFINLFFLLKKTVDLGNE